MAEYQAELAEVDRYLDDVHLREQDALRAECDAAESQRLWDWDFRRRWDAQHRGRDTREGCQCALHRAWRRETPQ